MQFDLRSMAEHMGGVAWGVVFVLSVMSIYWFSKKVLNEKTAFFASLIYIASLQMAVQFLQPALVAVRRHRQLVVAWVCGGAAFGLAFLIPLEPIDRGVLAQLVGPVATLVLELVALHRVITMTAHPVRQPRS